MEWRICREFPRYEVSEFGDVRRLDTKRVRSPQLTTAGYPAVGLRKDGRTKTVTIHSLVAAEFIGQNPFDGAEICHRDNSKSNNHYTNLRWDTHIGNLADSSFGLGECNSQAKLTTADVIEIRRMRAVGFDQQSICRRFNMSKASISDIVNRKRWAHVA